MAEILSFISLLSSSSRITPFWHYIITDSQSRMSYWVISLLKRSLAYIRDKVRELGTFWWGRGGYESWCIVRLALLCRHKKDAFSRIARWGDLLAMVRSLAHMILPEQYSFLGIYYWRYFLRSAVLFSEGELGLCAWPTIDLYHGLKYQEAGRWDRILIKGQQEDWYSSEEFR